MQAIARPEKLTLYAIGGFEFRSRENAVFLWAAMQRSARLETEIYKAAVRRQEKMEGESLENLLAEKQLAYWQNLVDCDLSMHTEEIVELVRRLLA